MTIDYHIHLEEGPYSHRWWQRTAQAIMDVENASHDHTLPWMKNLSAQMDQRIQAGSLSANWLDYYLKQAKKIGLKEVGIVDHLYRFQEFKAYYETHMYLEDDELGQIQRTWLNQVCTEKKSAFVDLIQSEKKKWASEGIELKLGIEADYFQGGESELRNILNHDAWDYVIGSVHFVDGWGFDNPITQKRFETFNLTSLYQRFFDLVERSINSGLFDIIAHLDNLKVFGYRPDESMLIPHYRRIADRLKEADVASEVNAGLAYRYPIQEMCPSPNFLQILADYQVPVTVSSDAHFPDDIGKMGDQAAQQLRACGYESVAVFDQRVRKERML